MLPVQAKYVEFLQSLKDELQKLSALDIESFGIDNAIANITSTELLIPVIGGFSAGKSSLLNSFLQEEILSVAVTPETALATELHYSTQEYVEAITPSGQSVRFEKSQMEQLKNKASEFSYAKLYLNKQCLKDIEPLVLVDMPGFESPLASHNKAIFEYIRRGVYFVILQSVEHGNITASVRREIDNLLTFERKFSFFLSKSNLKPQSELDEIRSFIQEQLSDYFDYEGQVECIGKDGGTSLAKIISTLNPNAIVEDLYLTGLKDRFSQIKQTINTHITALSQDKEQNAKDIQDLKNGLQKLEQERDSLIAQVQERYGDTNINKIINGVNNALNRGLNEIAQSYMSGGDSALDSTINSIVKTTLSQEVKTSMEHIGEDVIHAFGKQLEDSLSIMQRLSLGDTICNVIDVKKIGSTATTLFTNATESMAKYGGIVGAIGKIGVFIAPIINPLLTAIVSLLPTLVQLLFGDTEQKKLESVKNALLTQVFPQILAELRAKLPPELQEQTTKLIESISQEFEEQIAQKLQAIESAQGELEGKKQEIEQMIATYKEALDSITALANTALYA
ncbi:dynamin family protein [Helicobacter canis]|uniref:GTPase n=1 Tax=Helicobacter canis TaxID=29419 RepID=A0A377J541_9HELI|nr:dynamin family protein [Helicobacter canis]STO97439.1 GTPase [Helicobacter canis]